MIPWKLMARVDDALRAAGDASPVHQVKRLTGGHVSQTMRLVTDRHRYVLKWSDKSPPGMYTMEARGLALLGQTGVRVPAVLAVSDAEEETPRFLLQEWIDCLPLEEYWHLGRSLGEQLAALQQASLAAGVQSYGLDYDNFLGVDRQLNGWETDWVSFYREKRLRCALAIAERRGHLSPEEPRRVERLLDRLPELLGEIERPPVLLHGEIWKHNVLFDRQGRLVLIDPAVSYGDREFDVAAVGGNDPMPRGFEEAYHAVWPLAPGWEVRRDIYQLFWLFFFGRGWWRERRERILRRYGGT
jgi:fructosamine-3-kinase